MKFHMELLLGVDGDGVEVCSNGNVALSKVAASLYMVKKQLALPPLVATFVLF